MSRSRNQKKADASAAAPKTNPMLMLNSRELDKLSEIYDYFDHNGDGALTIEELIESVNDYMDKYPVGRDTRTDRERIISVIRETVECIDTDGSGTIEINELLIAFRSEIGGGAHGIVRAVAKFATWFAAVDVSDDKQISRQELFTFMKQSIQDNPDFTEDEKQIMEKRCGYMCRKVIDKIDKDGDGTVSVKEAVNAMRGSWKEW